MVFRYYFFVFILVILICSLLPLAVFAQQRLVVELGKSIVLDGSRDVGSLFISDPSIADATVADNNAIFVFGLAAGETTLVASSLTGNQQTRYTIVVNHPISEIRQMLSQRFPGQAISVESSRGSIMLTGSVNDDINRATVVESLQSAFPALTVIDRLNVSGSGTIRLQVRLLEVNRSIAETYGIDWNATVAGSGFFVNTSNRGILRFGSSQTAETRLDATIDVLTTNNIATINQVTELSTVIGQAASFSVGGEIPVPGFTPASGESVSGNFQLDYKFVGTDLKFTPTQVPGNKIQLLIESTVSSDAGSSGSINGNSFPNLSKRSFRTTVEMVDRQSFAIAGLSRQEGNDARRDARGDLLSNIVNNVFGTDSATKSSSELVVIITPYFGPATVTRNAQVIPNLVSNLDHILSGATGFGKFGQSGAGAFGGFKY